MFVVRFVRFNNEQSVQDNDGLTFVVKTIDRPSITPTVEELHQYNKKRQITTGYKMQDVRLVLYDTADNLIFKMWDEYTRWYFGDFNQTEYEFSYDVTVGLKDNGSGFGYVPRPSRGAELDMSSQFFFKAVEVYQVFGGTYTQFDLINPKIKQFDPDELDYALTDVSTVTMGLGYEAIIYRNQGEPADIRTRTWLAEVFGDRFNGEEFAVPGAPERGVVQWPEEQTMDGLNLRPDLPFGGGGRGGISSILSNPLGSLGGGSLGMFGDFDFGGLGRTAMNAVGAGRQLVNTGRSLAGDVSYLRNGNPNLSTALNITRNAVGKTQGSSAILGSTVDALSGALGGTAKNDYGRNYLRENVVGGVLASGSLGGGSPTDIIRKKAGLGLNQEAYGVMNAQRPSSSQVGRNTSAYTPPVFSNAPDWTAPAEGSQWSEDDYSNDALGDDSEDI